MGDWHIHCSKCGDVIGIWPDDILNLTERDNVHPMLRCKGKGTHPPPNEQSIRIYWGIAEEFFCRYPETNTQERMFRYIGPPWWPLVLFVLLFIVKCSPHQRFKKIRVSGEVVLLLPGQRTFWKRLSRIFSTKNSGCDRGYAK